MTSRTPPPSPWSADPSHGRIGGSDDQHPTRDRVWRGPLGAATPLVLLLACAAWAGLTSIAAVAAAAPPTAGAEARPEGRPPNVLLILSDDQGSVDVGCYGAKDLVTPNLDALAAGGVRFTQFYVAAPVCSPSRAALLTGRYPQRAGLVGNASSQPGGPGMPGDQVTTAEVMKAAGYATGHVGKWHLGYRPESMPNAQGFDSSFGHMGGCIDNYSHFFYWDGPNRHDLWRDGKEVWQDGQYFGDLMTAECRRFIRANRDRPFFLYWAINQPHYPLQGAPKWREHYAKAGLTGPRAMYAASVSTVDEMVGQVLATLDELKLREQTIVVFFSDHGHSTEERTFGGGGSAGSYRGAKFSLFEGGIRVPAIVSWPGHLPGLPGGQGGQVRGQLATSCDWLPTLAELCGVRLPEGPERRIDGRSLVPVLRSADAPTPHPVFHWATGRDQWAVRDGDWKLLGNPVDTSKPAARAGQAQPAKEADLYLVNVAEDPGEAKNLAAERPQVVERLRRLHEQWLADVTGRGARARGK